MTTFLWSLLALLGSIALLYLAFLLLVSALSVRPPRIPVFLSPAQLGDPEEVVEFETSDGLRLRGWWVQGGGETTIVCFHGFLGNRCEWVPYSPRFRAMGASLMFVDHRCHGTSQRAKCTFGIDEAMDVEAAVRYARERNPGCKIVLLGSSMGGTAVARAVAINPCLADAVILDGPYANLHEAAKGFWYVTGFRAVATLMSPAVMFGRLFLGFDPRTIDMRKSYAKLADTPTLFLFGDADMVVPVASASRCVVVAGARVEWFAGCGHAQGRYAEAHRYFEAMSGFLNDHGMLESPSHRTVSGELPIFSRPGSV